MRTIIAFKNPKPETAPGCYAAPGISAGNAAAVLVDYGIAAEAVPVARGKYLRHKLRKNMRPF